MSGRAQSELRSTEATTRSETDGTVTVETEDACPECGGVLRADERQSEIRCSECGLVVEENEIDPGPEWRAFDSEEREEKSRVGAPTTKLLHDDGLSTEIGWQDKDAYGNMLDPRKREQMQRLRTWNQRFKTRDAKERNLKKALGEIERMASTLGLPEDIRETASVIYRRALEEDLLPGRSIEGVASAALYAAARQAGTPRSLDEVAPVSRIDKQELARTYRYVSRKLELAVEPADPADYVPRFTSELGLIPSVERRARELLDDAKEAGIHSGKSPVGLAAAAIYAASMLANDKTTQTEVSEVADVSEVTIRNRYQELVEVSDDVEPA